MYVDGRASDAERLAIEAHLADCEACRDTAADAASLRAELGLARPPARSSWTQPWLGLAAAVVLAASGWIVIRYATGRPDQLQQSIQVLASKIGGVRLNTARLSGPFAYGPPPSVTRGANRSKPPIEAVQAALDIEKIARDSPDEAALAAVGTARLATGEIDAGIRALEDAVTRNPKHADAQLDLSAGYLSRFQQHGDAQDAARALNAAAAALLLRPSWPAALFNRALALEGMGARDQAADAWRSYLAEAKDDGEWRQEGSDHLKRLTGGIAQSDPRRLERAMLEILANRAVSRADQDSLHRASIELRRADRDRFVPDVIDAWSKADAARRDCLSQGIAALLQSRQAFALSDYGGAADHAAEAMKLLTCGRAGALEASVQVAWVQYFQGQKDSAIAQLKFIASEAQRARYDYSAGRAAYLQGQYDVAAGRVSDGQQEYEAALSAARRVDDADLTASVLNGQAEALRLFGEPQRAWPYHAAAFEFLPSVTPRLRHMVLAGAGLTATQSRLPAAAETFAEAMVRNAPLTSDAALATGAHLQLARALVDLESLPAATAELTAAGAQLQSIGDPAVRRSFQAELDWIGGSMDVSVNPQRAIPTLTRAFGSVASVRRAEVLLERGRAHLKLGERPQALEDWEQGIELFEAEKPQVASQLLRIARTSRLWDLFGEVIAATLEDPETALATAERSRARDLFDQLGQRGPSSTFRLPLDWLPADTAVFYYVTLPRGLAVWRLDRSQTKYSSIDVTSEDLRREVVSFVEALRDGRDTRRSRIEALLLPVGWLDGASRLIFVPDGDLHAVPFAAMHVGDSSERLVDRHVIAVAPSLTILRAGTIQPSPDPAPRVLLIGAGAADSTRGLPALPAVTTEIAGLVRLYSSRKPIVLEGDLATPSRILHALPRSTVVHFAGHAVADDWYPSKSVLVTAPDSSGDALTRAQIGDIHLAPGALVVLSACDTARGKTYRGEGPITLARPFLAAGAGHVLSALWAIRDTESADLVLAFHDAVAHGASPDVSLAMAQRQAIRKGVSAGVWSAFQLVEATVTEGSH